MDEIDRLRQERLRTRREIADTWAALRSARARRKAGAADESRAYAGSKPDRPGWRPSAGMLAAGALGLAMVIPRMIRRRTPAGRG
jgi:hypothetical protein